MNGARWPCKALLLNLTEDVDGDEYAAFRKILDKWTMAGCTGFVAFENLQRLVDEIVEPHQNVDIQIVEAPEFINKQSVILEKAVTLITCQGRDLSPLFVESISNIIDGHNPLISVISRQHQVSLQDILSGNRFDIPQSFEFRNGNRLPRTAFNQYPLLALWWHPGSTRQDNSSHFSARHVFENNSNHCISTHHYLTEIFDKVGLTEKYGA